MSGEQQRGGDAAGVLRGLQSVLAALARMQQERHRQLWHNCSARTLLEDAASQLRSRVEHGFPQDRLVKNVRETLERASMVVEGVKQYVKYSAGQPPESKASPEQQFMRATGVDPRAGLGEAAEDGVVSSVSGAGRSPPSNNKATPEQQFTRATGIDLSVSSRDVGSAPGARRGPSPSGTATAAQSAAPPANGTDSRSQSGAAHQLQAAAQGLSTSSQHTANSVGPEVRFRPKQKQTLSSLAKARSVPASRVGRFMSFGGLAAGLGAGALAEMARRSLGGKRAQPSVSDTLDTAFLSEANAERIVNTLCKVRGAALKLGQLLSIQDNTIISPGLQRAFERVRQSADFMPVWQVEKVLSAELGADWRRKLAHFEMKPFAAASIGQVHHVTLLSGREAAMKIQYPGVARGITSDIDNLVGILKVWRVFPDALFIDNIVAVAQRELAWEVDYERELQCTKRFKELLRDYPQYYVPDVIEELSTRQVFTSELIDGMPVDQCAGLDAAARHRVARLVMELCLKELFQFLYMQTDPNWSNFFYNPDTDQLLLLDFGASREYSREFMDQYIEVIRAAADGDRDKVLRLSKDIGFLTGYESKVMNEAHVDTVMVLGEVFRDTRGFDFGAQSTTRQVQRLVPTMLQHRLCPPPEEIYSLHRKLSGVFLLCAKLRVRMECRSLFEDAYARYHAAGR
ncbi:atypical kinase COQ8B, mitochondrial [Bacillus rossius redtenbacheri]|uniref:atypical kinase COQ8B, mitochondrial n=1 Tax=Bacillus rossius redtenbacheri TaxID=93214 RepID=UPI002FDE2B91